MTTTTRETRPRWQVDAATVPGRKRIPGTPDGGTGQDRHAWRVTPQGCLIAAVADGCGSSIHGGPGAGIAVKTFLDTSLNRIRNQPEMPPEEMADTVQESLLAAADTVRRHAAACGDKYRDYHTTLLGIIANDNGTAVTRIGDGSIVVRRRPDAGLPPAWETALPPQQGEYANSTWYITQDNPELRLDVKAYCPGDIEAVAIFTDGLQNLCLVRETEQPFAGFFDQFARWQTLPASPLDRYQELRRFLTSRRVQDRTDDDCTLLLARRQPCRTVPTATEATVSCSPHSKH